MTYLYISLTADHVRCSTGTLDRTVKATAWSGAVMVMASTYTVTSTRRGGARKRPARWWVWGGKRPGGHSKDFQKKRIFDLKRIHGIGIFAVFSSQHVRVLIILTRTDGRR